MSSRQTPRGTDAELDPLIHELARLRICAALRTATALDSAALREAAQLSDSALSKHLKRLVEAGYADQRTGEAKGRGRPRTWVSLTEAGRSAYDRHVAELHRLTRG